MMILIIMLLLVTGYRGAWISASFRHWSIQWSHHLGETYKTDRFEPVTKPASWSSLGSAGEDAILRESLRPLTRAFCLYTFWYLKFLENFYLYFISCYSTRKCINQMTNIEDINLFRYNKRFRSIAVWLRFLKFNNLKMKPRDRLAFNFPTVKKVRHLQLSILRI